MIHRVAENEVPDVSEPRYVRYLMAAADILRTPHLTHGQAVWAESVSAEVGELVRRATTERLAYEAVLMVAQNYQESGDPFPSELQRFCTDVATGKHPAPARPRGRPRNTIRDRIIANAVHMAAHEGATVNEDGSIASEQSRPMYANGNKPDIETACDAVADALKRIVARGENVPGIALSGKEVQTIWVNSDRVKAEK